MCVGIATPPPVHAPPRKRYAIAPPMQIAKLLLMYGADPDVEDKKGQKARDVSLSREEGRWRGSQSCAHEHGCEGGQDCTCSGAST